MSTYAAIGPDQIEAVQWTGENAEEVLAFTDAVVLAPVGAGLFMQRGPERGIEDWIKVEIGTWIVRLPDDDRHFWPYHWLVEERAFPELYQGVPA